MGYDSPSVSLVQSLHKCYVIRVNACVCRCVRTCVWTVIIQWFFCVMLSYSFNPLHFGWQRNSGLTLWDDQKNLRSILCCNTAFWLCFNLTSDYILIFCAVTLQAILTFHCHCLLYCVFQECSPSPLSLSLFLCLSLNISLIIASQTEQCRTWCQNRHEHMLINQFKNKQWLE